jgi:hypothetical protein
MSGEEDIENSVSRTTEQAGGNMSRLTAGNQGSSSSRLTCYDLARRHRQQTNPVPDFSRGPRESADCRDGYHSHCYKHNCTCGCHLVQRAARHGVKPR